MFFTERPRDPITKSWIRPLIVYCRVCGIELDYENTAKSCGNICQDCQNWKQTDYYQSHKEQCKQYIDPEKQKEAVHKYYENHSDRVCARVKKYRQNNPEKYKLLWKLREFRERGAVGSFTCQEWLDKLAQFDYRCAYCRRKTEDMTRDHAIPIIRGGSNNIGNLIPACRTCNSRKHTKTAEEFMFSKKASAFQELLGIV